MRHLTGRQEECARLWAQGMTQAEIGESLGIRQDAVSRHLKRARRKLQGYSPQEITVDPFVLDRLDPRRIVASL